MICIPIHVLLFLLLTWVYLQQSHLSDILVNGSNQEVTAGTGDTEHACLCMFLRGQYARSGTPTIRDVHLPTCCGQWYWVPYSCVTPLLFLEHSLIGHNLYRSIKVHNCGDCPDVMLFSLPSHRFVLTYWPKERRLGEALWYDVFHQKDSTALAFDSLGGSGYRIYDSIWQGFTSPRPNATLCKVADSRQFDCFIRFSDRSSEIYCPYCFSWNSVHTTGGKRRHSLNNATTVQKVNTGTWLLLTETELQPLGEDALLPERRSPCQLVRHRRLTLGTKLLHWRSDECKYCLVKEFTFEGLFMLHEATCTLHELSEEQVETSCSQTKAAP